MAVTHSTAARNAATNAVTLLLNASGAGKLIFRTTGNVTAPGTAIATLTFSATAFGASSSGTATANAITSDTNAAGGTVATATLETGAAVVVVHCDVSGSGSDINLTGGLNVTAGDTVSCSSLTYTALTA
jgi:hypothetical protein